MAAGASQPTKSLVAVGEAGTRPLFGGYVLVALVAAWLAGIVLRAAGPLASIPAAGWLALAGLGAALGAIAVLVGRLGGVTRLSRAQVVTGLLLCCAALGAARAAATDPANDPHSLAPLANGQSVVVQGDVAAEPDLRDGKRILTVDASQVSLDGGTTWQPAAGRVQATVYGPDDWFAPAYGDTLQLSGKLDAANSNYYPPGVLAAMPDAKASILARGGGNPLLGWLFNVRLALAQGIQRSLPEPEASLLIGILLGLKTPVLRARLALFTSTGTIHLVVPAGLKVSVLAELATSALRRLGHVARTAAGLIAIAGYAALGGGGAAALRAAIMGALLVVAPALGRRYNVYTALALAVLLMTAVEPLLVYDAGFQLTALATLGLPLFVPPLQRALLARLRGLARVPAVAVAVELVAVTLAAQLATLPVLALSFHVVSLVAPLANLVTVPLLAPLMALGGALALATLLPAGLGGALVLALTWITWPLLWLVDSAIAFCAGLPAASLATPDLPPFVGWAYYAALAAAWWWVIPRIRARLARRAPVAPAAPGSPATAHSTGHVRLGRGVLVGLVALSALGACGAALPQVLAGRTARLDFLDVGGGGEATLLRLPSGRTVLINGGPSGPALEAALAGKLPFWQRTLDVAILTDLRPGDMTGMQDAIGHFAIAQAADAGMAHPNTNYLAWLDALARGGTRHVRIRQDDVLTLDATSDIRVLSPPQALYPSGEGDTAEANDLILRLETPGLRVLLLGAADAYALDALVGAGEPLTADVVEVALAPGQGIDLTTPLGAVLAAAHPKLIVVDDAPVTPTTKTALALAATGTWLPDGEVTQALGALVYRTSAAGTISLSGGAGGWSVGG